MYKSENSIIRLIFQRFLSRMLRMKEALRRFTPSPSIKRKVSSPSKLCYEPPEERDIFRCEEKNHQLAALSLTDLTDSENNSISRRKLSYHDIVQLREDSKSHRKKSENLIETLSLDSKGAELSALIASHTPIRTENRKQNGFVNDNPKTRIPTRKKSIEVIVRNQPRRKSRKKKSSSYEPQQLLERAIYEGYIEIATGLIKSGQVNVNKLNAYGYAPLHLAAMNEQTPQIVKVLIDLGASVNITDKSGFTPLEVAVNEGCFECAQLLIQNGADQSFIMHGRLDEKFT